MKFITKLLTGGLFLSSVYGMEMNTHEINPIIQAEQVIEYGKITLESVNELLHEMRMLSLQASANTIDIKEYQTLQQKFSNLRHQIEVKISNTIWDGVRLFDGCAGTAFALDPNPLATISDYGQPTSINSIKYAPTYKMEGFIDGAVYATGAKLIKPNIYELFAQTEKQTFSAITTPRPNGIINFEGIDKANKFSLTYAESVSDLADEQSFTNALQEYFLLNSITRRTKFLSACITQPATWNVFPSVAMEAGLWAVKYQNAPTGEIGCFQLSNGLYIEKIDVITSGCMTQNVTFSNGFNIALKDFDGTEPLGGQVIYSVHFNEGASIILQISRYNHLRFEFIPVNLNNLWTRFSNISTNSGASNALENLNNDLNTLQKALENFNAFSKELRTVCACKEFLTFNIYQ